MSYEENRSYSPAGSHHGRSDSQSHALDSRSAPSGSASNMSRSSGTGKPPTSNPDGNAASMPRATSAPYNQARKPIKDAVASAFDGTNNAFSPELIQQITQNVLQQLQSQSIPLPAMQPQQHPTAFVADQADATSSSPNSPLFGREQVYTPPSPHRPGEELSHSQTLPNISTSPTHQPKANMSRQREVSPFSQGSYVGTHPETAEESTPRPLAPQRNLTDDDATVLEKIWGRLFDEQGQGTLRLAQFLRGIAMHLVEDYEPKGSLVVTPAKMQQFYKDTTLKDKSEIYPWHTIFDDHTSSISRMLREVSVQHHLVQERLDTRPDIPGLTPDGFATWFTLMLQAHPDHEFERLTITARDMPISNPDERKERFPKELSRRQFPTKCDESIARKLQRLMAQHCNVNIQSRQDSMVENEQQRAPANPKQADGGSHSSNKDSNAQDKQEPFTPFTPHWISGDSAFTEKVEQPAPDFVLPPRRRSTKLSDGQQSALKEQLQRAAGPTVSSETAVDDDTSEAVTPQAFVPIERERKPYVAQPGGGKNYDVSASSSSDERMDNGPPPPDPQLRRTNSVTSNGRLPRAAPVSLHQKTNPSLDGPELSKIRSATMYVPEFEPSRSGNTTRDRARSNAGYPPNDVDLRPTRSNTTYYPDGRANSKPAVRARSPSRPKALGDEPRASAPDMSYGSYHSTSSYGLDSHRSSDRYDNRPGGHDGKDTRYERDGRTRYHNAGSGNGEPYNVTNDDYFRGSRDTNVQHTVSHGSGQSYTQFPPSAYRDGR